MMARHRLPVYPAGKASCYELNSFLRTYCLGQEPKTRLKRQALAPIVHQATTVGRRQAIKHTQQVPNCRLRRAHLQVGFGKWLAQRCIDRARSSATHTLSLLRRVNSIDAVLTSWFKAAFEAR